MSSLEIIADTREVKTRKPQWCAFCNRKFPTGSPMKVQVNKIEGEIGRVYSCKTCDTLIDEYPEPFRSQDYGWFESGVVENWCHQLKINTPETLLEMLHDGRIVAIECYFEPKEETKP